MPIAIWPGRIMSAQHTAPGALSAPWRGQHAARATPPVPDPSWRPSRFPSTPYHAHAVHHAHQIHVHMQDGTHHLSQQPVKGSHCMLDPPRHHIVTPPHHHATTTTTARHAAHKPKGESWRGAEESTVPLARPSSSPPPAAPATAWAPRCPAPGAAPPSEASNSFSRS